MFTDVFDWNITTLFDKPYHLVKNCSANLTYKGLVEILSNERIQLSNISSLSAANFTNDTQLQCCDYELKPWGYQFTSCEKGFGAFVIASRKRKQGTPLDAIDYRSINIPWDLGY
jgi:hypothetical protein